MNTVLFVNPATPEFDMGLFPPLALPVLAAAVPEGHEVRLVDENRGPVDFDADLACISANTYSIRRAYELAREFRRRGIAVVLGGNHPSILPEEAAAHADSVVIGDGESVIPLILADFERRALRPVYQAGRYGFEQTLVPRKDLLAAPYRFDSVETVRGCPFDCDFCSVTRFHGATWRHKPLEAVEAELERLNGRTVFLVDDNVIGTGRHAEERALRLFDILENHRVRWMGQASINIADNPLLLDRARASGCIFLFIGFESLDPEILKSLNKRQNVGRSAPAYGDVVRRIHAHGISIMGSFIIGTDHDTGDSIRRLRDFILESGIDVPNITHLTPYPGTRVYDRLQASGRLFDERFWLRDPFPLFTFEPQRITVPELRTATAELLSEFTAPLSSVRRFVRTLAGTRSVRTASFSTAATGVAARGLLRRLRRVEEPEIELPVALGPASS